MTLKFIFPAQNLSPDSSNRELLHIPLGRLLDIANVTRPDLNPNICRPLPPSLLVDSPQLMAALFLLLIDSALSFMSSRSLLNNPVRSTFRIYPDSDCCSPPPFLLRQAEPPCSPTCVFAGAFQLVSLFRSCPLWSFLNQNYSNYFITKVQSCHVIYFFPVSLRVKPKVFTPAYKV